MVEEKGRRIKVVIEGFAFEVSAFSLYIDWWEFLNAYFRQGRSDLCEIMCRKISSLAVSGYHTKDGGNDGN
jgi:hypothetical protein